MVFVENARLDLVRDRYCASLDGLGIVVSSIVSASDKRFTLVLHTGDSEVDVLFSAAIVAEIYVADK